MLRITKDNVPSLRGKCKDVGLPLTEKDKNTLNEMLEYLKLSQDPTFKSKHSRPPDRREQKNASCLLPNRRWLY